MDHPEAIKLQAAEKYLMGELPAEQRDQFEDHFFGCMECAADIRTGAILVDNARKVLKDEADTQKFLVPSRPGRGWFGWLQPAWGLAAAVVLVGVLTYQNLVTIPSLKHAAAQPEALASYSFVTAGSRAGGSTVIRTPKDHAFGVYIDIPASNSFPYYTVDIQTESGARPVHVQVSAEQAKDTVQILVPGGALKPGNATLLIEGHADLNSPPTEVARYPFVMQVQ
jgi:hypothetical protein